MKKLLPISFLFLAACELVVDIDVPRDKDRLVLNSVQQPDSTWMIDLTRSRYILDGSYSYISVDYASVIVTDDNNNTINFNYDGNYYRSNVYPEPGRHYKVTAEAAQFETIDAEFTMPAIITMTNIVFDTTQTVQGPNQYSLPEIPLEITFYDPPGVANYYNVAVYYYYVVEYMGQNGEKVRDSVMSPASVRLNEPGLSTRDDYRSEFPDITFDGQTFTVHARVTLNPYYGSRMYRYEVRFGHLSPEYSRYKETWSLQNGADGDPFAQPAQVYSNINNGFGVFGGISYDVKFWEK